MAGGAEGLRVGIPEAYIGEGTDPAVRDGIDVYKRQGQEEAAWAYGADPRRYCTTATEFLAGKNGNVNRVRTVELEPEKNAGGRPKMVPRAGSEKELPADLVLIAAGFTGAESYCAESFGVSLDSRGRTAPADGSHRTANPAVFTAGDMRRGCLLYTSRCV